MSIVRLIVKQEMVLHLKYQFPECKENAVLLNTTKMGPLPGMLSH